MAAILLRDAEGDLRAAVSEHGDELIAEKKERADGLLAEWQQRVGELIPLHARLTAALTELHALDPEQPHRRSVGSIGLKPGQINELEIAASSRG